MQNIKFIFLIVISICLVSCKKDANQTYATIQSDADKSMNQYNNLDENDELATIDYTEQFNNFQTSKAKLESDLLGEKKLLVILPLTGPNEIIGKQLLQGIELVESSYQDLNLQKIVIDENQYDYDLQKEVARYENEALAVIGPLTSKKALNLTKEMDNFAPPIFTLSNDINLQNHGNLFVTGLNPDEQLNKILEHVSQRKHKEFFVILPANDYGHAISTKLQETLDTESYSTYQTLYYHETGGNINDVVNEIAEHMKARREEDSNYQLSRKGIFIVDFDQKIDKLVARMRDSGVLSFGANIYGLNQFKDFSKFAKAHLKNARFSSYFSDEKNQFEKEFYKKYNSKPSELVTVIFDVANLIYDNINRNDYQVNQSEFYSDDGYIGLNGNFRFKANNIIQRDIAVVEFANDGSLKQIVKPTYIN